MFPQLNGQKMPIPWSDGNIPESFLEVQTDNPSSWKLGEVDEGYHQHSKLEVLEEVAETTESDH